MPTQIPDAVSWKNFLVHPENVASREPVGESCPRQVPDEGVLRVGLVLVGAGAVAAIEADVGRHPALSESGVTAGLSVGGPAQPVVDEHDVSAHFVRHKHRLEGVGLKAR